MSNIQPLPFTLNLYNSYPPDFSDFLVHTYRAFFNVLFEKYQIIYGFNPEYLIKKHKIVEKNNAPQNMPWHPCIVSQDILETYHKFFEFVHEDPKEWNVILKNDNLEILKKQFEGSPCHIIRSKARLEKITSNQIFDAIYDIEKRKKWDMVFDQFEQKHKFNENLDIIYFSIKSPFPFVSSREFLQRRHVIKHFPTYNQTVIQFKSIDLPDIPPDPKKIRGETLVSGYLITTLDKDTCQLELISMVDIKGDIPKFLYNLVAQKAPVSWIENLKNYCLGKPINKKIF